MNFIVEGEFKLTEDIRSIERRICRFYEKVIKDYYDLDENFNPKYWRSSYRKKQTREKRKLFLQCIQDTCLGLRKFYASLTEYKEIAKYLSNKKPIIMYCVQGESLLSALGICLVIDEAVEKYRITGKPDMKQIQLVVTEKDQNWKRLCSYIAERVNSCYKNVEIKLELISERSNRLPVEVFRTLREVDIVVIARYFSQFHNSRIKTHFLEVILKRMKELSILFYLDTYYETYKDTLKRLFSKFDSLIEIRSKKVVYTPLRNPRNKKYFWEFPFFFSTAFEDVMYSTCVKYSGITYNGSSQKGFKNEVSLLRHSRREMKLKISDSFEKENSLSLPFKDTFQANSFQAKTLITTLRKLLNASNRKTKSVRKNSMVILNMSDYANFSPSKSLILNPSVNSKKKATKRSKNGNAFPLSTTLRNKANLNSESRGGNAPNTGAFKASKIIGKLISMNLENNNYKYFEMESNQRSNAETIRTSKCSGVTANVHNKSKYSEENKQNAEIDRSTKFAEKIFSKNLYNKNKYRCPYLSTKDSVTRYAYYLAEIYYSKHFDRKKLSAPKFKSNKHLKN